MADTAPSDLVVAAARLVPATPGAGVLSPGYVVVSGGRVAEAGPGPPPRPAHVGLSRGVLVPGFVDLQGNGYYGEELATAGPAGLGALARRPPATGTTAVLPPVITAP